jgi:type II secretory pathway component GspD/PulD (secretin)
MLAGVLAAQAGFAFGQEQDAAEAEQTTLIVSARGIPVAELAESLRVLAPDDVTIVAEPLTNHIILRGSRESVEPLVAVVEQLDRLPRRIEVRLLMVEIRDVDVQFVDGAFDDYADALEQLQANGAATVVSRVRLSTLENNVAQVQVGATKPAISGRTFDRGGRGGNSYVMNTEGTLVAVTPRTSSDGTIVMELNVEQTRIEDAEQPSAEDSEEVVPSTLTTASVNTTISLKDGETVTLTDFAEASGESARKLVVIVTARAIEN